jgi:alkylated DNA nucleotide flippase Atl1
VGARAGRPRPTKPAIKLSKRVTNLPWRRIINPQGGQSSIPIWSKIKEEKLEQDEIEELFENKVKFIF